MAATHPSRRRSVAGHLTVALAALVLLGCGADGSDQDGAIPEGYPTVASPDLHGRFDMTRIVTEDGDVDLGGRPAPVVTIDVVTGGIDVDLICNRHLGSFTLDPGGRASISLTGGTTEGCGADAELERNMLAIFDRIDRWEPSAGGFQLTSGAGDLIGLSRS